MCVLPFLVQGQASKFVGKEGVNRLNELAEKYHHSEPQKARQYAQEALELAQNENYALGKALAYKNIGIVYHVQGNHTQALAYFLKALPAYEQIKNQEGIAHTLHDIGVVYQDMQKFEDAKNYYNRVLEIDKKIQDKKGEASTLNNLADLYFQQDQNDKALEYYLKSLQLRQSVADSAGIAVSLANIGLVRYAQNDYKTALAYFAQSLKIDEKLQNLTNQSTTLGSMAEAYLKSERIDSAEVFALHSFALAEKISLKRELIVASGILADIYTIKKNYEKALEYKNVQMMFKEDYFNEENTRKITDLQNSYQLDQAQAQNVLLQKNREFDRLLLISGSVAGVLLLALLFLLYRNNQRKAKINALLKEQNEAILLKNAEINQQNEEIQAQRDAIEAQLQEIGKQRDTIEIQKNEIHEKNVNIESSIRYALRIQEAMLPYEAIIDDVLPYNFIFYLPRDVVSGDFYWFGKIAARPIYEERETFEGIQRTLKGFQNELIVISAIDCTGHGVPGAFMSMIGNAQLNQIVKDEKFTKADKILAELHKGIREALKQSETQNRDGMDLALCVIDKEKKTLEYAGAKNSLIYIQNGVLEELKATNQSVGGYQDPEEIERKYEASTLSFAESSVQIYLHSDGYQDQFGGAEGKKFMRKNLKKLLLEIHEEPMAFQKNILEKTFHDWKGDFFQIDDVLVMGIKLD
jgi:tetratricopeptide (TPR) repeat protein